MKRTGGSSLLSLFIGTKFYNYKFWQTGMGLCDCTGGHSCPKSVTAAMWMVQELLMHRDEGDTASAAAAVPI